MESQGSEFFQQRIFLPVQLRSHDPAIDFTKTEAQLTPPKGRGRFTRATNSTSSLGLTSHLGRVVSTPCIASSKLDLPVPSTKFLHKSDLGIYHPPKRESFFERVQRLTRSAKNALRKAFSTESIYRPQREEQFDASGKKSKRSSLMKNLKQRKHTSSEDEPQSLPHNLNSQQELPSLWNDKGIPLTQISCHLIHINIDGSQVIELTRPSQKPFGFFLARGRLKNDRGVFVSRMRDEETQQLLESLLEIGDEVLEINGVNVKNSDIMEVNELMAHQNSLLLTVLPYVSRKDL